MIVLEYIVTVDFFLEEEDLAEQRANPIKNGKKESRNGIIYEGGFNKHKKFEGYGIMRYPQGHTYSGNWVNGKFEGNG